MFQYASAFPLGVIPITVHYKYKNQEREPKKN